MRQKCQKYGHLWPYLAHFCRCNIHKKSWKSKKYARKWGIYAEFQAYFGDLWLKMRQIEPKTPQIEGFFIDLISSKISRIWAIYCPNERFLMEFALETRCSGKNTTFSGFSGFLRNRRIFREFHGLSINFSWNPDKSGFLIEIYRCHLDGCIFSARSLFFLDKRFPSPKNKDFLKSSLWSTYLVNSE